MCTRQCLVVMPASTSCQLGCPASEAIRRREQPRLAYNSLCGEIFVRAAVVNSTVPTLTSSKPIMRIYKSNIKVVIPRDLNLTKLLHQSAPDRQIPPSHLICKDNLTNRSITIGELRDRAGRLAHGVHRQYNTVEGDRFALLVPNC